MKMSSPLDRFDTDAFRVVADPARLAALHSYDILDTSPEEGFDDVVLLASQLCQTPVALVSLVTNDRQWFKARIGFPSSETDLGASVCAHALSESDLLIIADLAADPRTAANPLVTGEPFIRFYAGAPLRTPAGAALGSLCVIDRQPRPQGLTEAQATNLRALARQVVGLLELRRALANRDALLQEQRATISEIEALSATQAAVAAADGDLDRILDAVLAGAMRAVPSAEAGVVELVDGDMLDYRAVRGTVAQHRGLRVPLQGSLAGSCALTSTPLLVPDVLTDARVKQDLVEMLRLRSAVLAPVARAGKVLGVLKLHSSRPAAFTDRHLRQARLFAGVATAGLTEAREAEVRRTMRENERRRTALLELGDRLRETDQAERMSYAAAEIMGRTLGGTRAGYGTVDLAAETITIDSTWQEPGIPDIAGTHRLRNYGSFVDDLKRGDMAVLEDVDRDPRTCAQSAAFAALGVRSFINVPLIEYDLLVAVLYVHHDRPHVWTEEDFGFARSVADRTRAAIARVRAQEQQQLLNRELSHRMKNLLAMAQSIAMQTMRNATDVGQARDVLSGRLIALGRAHDLLMGGAIDSTEMEHVIRAALESHQDRPDRFRLEGPKLEIGTDQALSLALTMHELATNAAKYGALSNERGFVAIRWKIVHGAPEPRLRFSWTEIDGPPVTAPTSKGFGSKFIERGLATQIGGTLSLDYPPEGATCTIDAPLAAFRDNR